MPDRHTEYLKEMLLDVKNTLQEFHIAENAMEKADFEILTQAFVKMPQLKILNCSINRIQGA